MKSLPANLLPLLKVPQGWLLSLATCLVVIHLTLAERTGDSNFFGLSLLVWYAVFSRLQHQWPNLRWQSSLGASLIGAGLIGVFLLRSLSASGNVGVTILPLLGGLGLALFVSGFQGLKRYWREFILLGILAIPGELGISILNISHTLALVITKIVGFLLWYIGFQVSVEGNHLYFQTGGIIVNDACAGVNNLTYLVKVSVIFLLLFPLKSPKKRWIVPFVALVLAFVMNLFRVALLAVLSPSFPGAFEYWHEGQGSFVFTLVIVILFGCFYLSLLRQETT